MHNSLEVSPLSLSPPHTHTHTHTHARLQSLIQHTRQDFHTHTCLHTWDRTTSHSWDSTTSHTWDSTTSHSLDSTTQGVFVTHVEMSGQMLGCVCLTNRDSRQADLVCSIPIGIK